MQAAEQIIRIILLPPTRTQRLPAPAAVEQLPSYSAGNADDFAVIDDSDDLPF